jgi:hypothetical protein
MSRIFLITLFFILSFEVNCNASWLIFHKPEFKGKIVDIDTQEPIEGAVVVAIYRKEQIGLAPDSVDIDIDAREALTDRNGEFVIPSYTSSINPLSWSIPVQFIIFKPGYYCTGQIGLEEEFSGSKKHKIEIAAGSSKGQKFRALETGVLMLAKVAGKDRIESYNNIGGEIPIFKKQLPIAYEMKNNERPIAIRLEREWRNK